MQTEEQDTIAKIKIHGPNLQNLESPENVVINYHKLNSEVFATNQGLTFKCPFFVFNLIELNLISN
jgi:hypothetical protein